MAGEASEQVVGAVEIWIALPLQSIQALEQAPPIELITSPGQQQQQAAQPVVQITRTPIFFGWGETAPEPEFLPEYENIMADPRGSRKAHDRLYEGSDARVVATMTIWKEPLLQTMLGFVNFNSPPGMDGSSDIGTIMNAEGQSYEVWLKFPYAFFKPFMQAAGMVQGYHYLAAMMDGPQRRALGTKTNKIMVSWYCSGKYTAGAYPCYNNDLSALNGLSPDINRPFG
jgi:hypothetical protein